VQFLKTITLRTGGGSDITQGDFIVGEKRRHWTRAGLVSGSAIFLTSDAFFSPTTLIGYVTALVFQDGPQRENQRDDNGGRQGRGQDADGPA
jgi:hypothetical protein